MIQRNKEVENQPEIWKDQNQESAQNFGSKNNFKWISLEHYNKFNSGKIHKSL